MWNGAKSCVQGDEQIKKRNKENGNLSSRSHSVNFPTCGKKLKKNLELGVVVHTFNLSTGNADASRSRSLGSAWSRYLVLG